VQIANNIKIPLLHDREEEGEKKRGGISALSLLSQAICQ
jgi:hypothetical protein